MKKIVINNQFGGFGLSSQGEIEYLKRQGKQLFCYTDPTHSFRAAKDEKIYQKVDPDKKPFLMSYTTTKDLGELASAEEVFDEANYFYSTDLKRDDPDLVAIIEEFGSEAISGAHATLKIVEIPDDVAWHIEEYDGNEHVAEDHETWS